jgi:hypothetical protein
MHIFETELQTKKLSIPIVFIICQEIFTMQQNHLILTDRIGLLSQSVQRRVYCSETF